jgi:GNAT superfamily N-acetyltransferase
MLVDAEIEPRHDCSPWLASLFVAPAWRGQGVGRALVGAVEAHAAAHGIARLHLYTDAAEPFYAACGWTVLDRFMEDGTACVLMGRDLDR